MRRECPSKCTEVELSGSKWRSVQKCSEVAPIGNTSSTVRYTSERSVPCGGGDKVSCATNGQHRPYACVHSCRHDALTSLTSLSREIFMHFVDVAWLFSRSHGRLGGHGFESRVADWGNGKRGGEFGGVARGSEVARRQQSERSGSNRARSGPMWCRFGTLLYRMRFGTVRYSSRDTLILVDFLF